MRKLSAVRKVAMLCGLLLSISLRLFTGVALASVTLAGAAWADEECKDPIAQWQSREVLKAKLEQQGWVVKRIRIDDGCYEVRAMDEQGRRVKATYAPATLSAARTPSAARTAKSARASGTLNSRAVSRFNHIDQQI